MSTVDKLDGYILGHPKSKMKYTQILIDIPQYKSEKLGQRLKHLESLADSLIKDCQDQDKELQELMQELMSIGQNTDE